MGERQSVQPGDLVLRTDVSADGAPVRPVLVLRAQRVIPPTASADRALTAVARTSSGRGSGGGERGELASRSRPWRGGRMAGGAWWGGQLVPCDPLFLVYNHLVI